MELAGSAILGSVSIAEAVEAFAALHAVGAGVDVASCDAHELRMLTAGIRDGQRALDALLMRVGAAADAHNDSGVDPVGMFLGDGSEVRGRTARREVARAQTTAAMNRVGAAVQDGRIGPAQVDAITAAAKHLSAEQQQQLDSDEIVDAAVSLPADVFARRVRDEVERIKGDNGLADMIAKQEASSWKHWMDARSGMGKIAAEFDPERCEAIANAIDAEVTRLANAGGVSKTSNLAATAAFNLITGRSTPATGLPHINVIVDFDTLAKRWQ